jgi:DNA modification methylase|tara:strand:- start:1218 stop:1886 length:669 start_codon:yes stop_codon:yes gene_type:complete
MSSLNIINKDFRKCIIPKGLTITDPPYNIGYNYNSYNDNLEIKEYIELLSKIPTPCVIIHYPEETINILPKAIKIQCEEVVSWVYNNNIPKQSRLISWWGCKPDFSKAKQPYKNLEDKRIKKFIAKGESEGASVYDWWFKNQVKNVSKEKTEHPCQIPQDIIEKIILTTASKGDTIIDVFAGSGTTGIVANKLGYNSYLYEIDKNYCNIIKKRHKNQNIELF